MVQHRAAADTVLSAVGFFSACEQAIFQDILLSQKAKVKT